MQMEGPASFPRASLFVTSRLASVVQKFKRRLQQKVQQKKRKPNPFGASYQGGLRLRALSDLERSLPSKLLETSKEPRSSVEHPHHGIWVDQSLRDLNKQVGLRRYPLQRVAADNRLLLSHSFNNVLDGSAQNATLPHIAHLFDITTYLINKVEAIQKSKSKAWLVLDEDIGRLKDEIYLANLLHLLRRLQRIFFQALVHRSLTHLDEFARHWQTYWQQQSKLGDDWFHEFPTGPRPLSTTWPWNIRPSLVILWGVCWMFYPSNVNNVDNSPSPLDQPQIDPAQDWTLDFEDLGEFHSVTGPDFDLTAGLDLMASQRPSHSTPGTQAPAGLGQLQTSNLTSAGPLSARTIPAQPQLFANHNLRLGAQVQHPAQIQTHTAGISGPQFHEQGTGFNPAGYLEHSYSQTNIPYTVSPQSRDFEHPRWRNSSSGNFVADPYVSNATSQQQQLTTTTYDPSYGYIPTYETHHTVPAVQISPAAEPPYEISPATLRSPFNATRAMAGSDGYPSPHSEPERRASMTNTTPLSCGLTTDSALTPGSEGTRVGQISVQRGSPPRNAQGQIQCIHPECLNKKEVFRRPCEWNKHMDKHDRPYKCYEPGCDKIQGFTYSGGLLRHQREVHKKNSSPRQNLYCQYPGCNRNKTRPFTRKENLVEHVRRRHNPDGLISPTGLPDQIDADPIGIEPQKKRKRGDSPDYDHPVPAAKRKAEEPEEEEDEEGENLPSEVKRLKGELETSRREIIQLRAMIVDLEARDPRSRPRV